MPKRRAPSFPPLKPAAQSGVDGDVLGRAAIVDIVSVLRDVEAGTMSEQALHLFQTEVLQQKAASSSPRDIKKRRTARRHSRGGTTNVRVGANLSTVACNPRVDEDALALNEQSFSLQPPQAALPSLSRDASYRYVNRDRVFEQAMGATVGNAETGRGLYALLKTSAPQSEPSPVKTPKAMQRQQRRRDKQRRSTAAVVPEQDGSRSAEKSGEAMMKTAGLDLSAYDEALRECRAKKHYSDIHEMGHERDGWVSKTQRAMKSEMRALADDQLDARAQSQKICAIAQRLIPLEYMFSKNMSRYAQEHGCQTIDKTFGRIINNYLVQGMAAWAAFVEQDRMFDEDRAARHIERAYRGLRGRNRTAQKRAARDAAQAAFAKKRRRRIRIRHGAAQTIIDAARCHLAANVARKKRARLKAVACIERAWMRKETKTDGVAEVALIQLQERLATKIQKTYRGHLGRVRFKRRELHERIRRRAEISYTTMTDVILTDFQQNGAAHTIQKWYYDLPYRVRRRQKALRFQSAMLLVRAYYCFKARRRLRKLRTEKKRQEELVEQRKTAILTMQSSTRRYLARTMTFMHREAEEKRKRTEGEMAERARKIREAKEEALKKRGLFEKLRAKTKDRVLPRNGKLAKRFSKTRVGRYIWPPVARPPKQVSYKRSRSGSFMEAMRVRRANMSMTGMPGKRDSGLLMLDYKQQKKSAILIQASWRRFKARERLKAMKVTQRQRAVLFIQKHARQFLQWKQYLRSVVLAQIAAKRFVHRLLQRRRGALTIQLWWRRVVAQRHLKWLRAACTGIALVTQALGRQYIARQRVHRLRTAAILAGEDRVLGTRRFVMMREDEIKHQIMEVTYMLDVETTGELQRLFQHYCSFGDRNNRTRMDVSKFVKFAKECPKLFSKAKKINAQTAELNFMKSKPRDQSHVHYAEFVSAVELLADIRFPKLVTYGRYEGVQAKMCKLLQEHVFKSQVASQVSRELEEARIATRADRRLEAAARVVKRNYRNFRNRLAVFKMREVTRAYHHAVRLNKCASMVQRVWRGRQNRLDVANAMTRLWIKYIDNESGQPYWSNPRTGTSTWTKPAAFGNADVLIPIKVPDPERSFILTCFNCEEVTAAQWCVDCSQGYCTDCFHMVHHKGKKKDHMQVDCDVCIQCEFQVGTKICYQCEDKYCDTCFIDQHQRGNLQRHTYRPLIPTCENCNKWVALVKVDFGLGESALLCRVCHRESCASDPQMMRHPHGPTNYKPSQLIQYEADQQMKQDRLARKQEYEARQAVITEKKERLASTEIQRMWRGYSGRCTGGEYMKQRHEYLVLKKVDEKKMREFGYLWKDWFGKAPELPTDTSATKLAKKSRPWERKMAHDVLSGMGGDLEELLEKYRQSLIDKEANKVPKRVAVKQDYALHTRNVEVGKLKQSVKKAKRRQEKAKKAYQNARSAVGTPAERKEELKREMMRTRKEHDSLEKALKHANKLQAQALAIVRARKGISPIVDLITQARKEGMPLPFRVNVKQGSRTFVPTEPPNNSLKLGDRVIVGEAPDDYIFRVVLDSRRKKKRAHLFRRGTVSEPKVEIKAGEEHNITVDHDWTDLSGESVLIRRFPIMPPVDKIETEVGETVHESRPNQMRIKVLVLTANWLARKALAMVENFDDDSAVADWLQRTHDRLLEVSQKKKKTSIYVIDVEKGFALRDRLMLVREQLVTLGLRAQVEAENLRDLYKRWKHGAPKQDVVQQWLNRPQEQMEEVSLQLKSSASGDAKPLGEVMIDLECPADIAREIIKLKLGALLNERQCGGAFLFELKGNTVEADSEENLTMSVISPQRQNREGEMELRCIIVQDASVKTFTPIPIRQPPSEKEGEEEKTTAEGEEKEGENEVAAKGAPVAATG